MTPQRQPLRWSGQSTPRVAVERVKQGGQVKNDTHVRKLIEDTAESRYSPQGQLKDLSLGAVVTLALSFTAAEWSAVKKDSALLQETLDYFKSKEFQLDRWWTYWRNLQVVQPHFASLFLLEVTCVFWKDNVAGLIDGVMHLSDDLPVCDLAESFADERASKRFKANSFDRDSNQNIDARSALTFTTWKSFQREPQPSSMTVDQNHGASDKRTDWKLPRLRTGLNLSSSGAWLSEEPSSTIVSNPCHKSISGDLVKENATMMESEVLQYMLAKRPEQKMKIQQYVHNLTPQHLRDLYTTIFDPIGLHHHKLRDAFADLWRCLETAEAYVVERELDIPRSTCMSVEIDWEGDYEVKVKVGRDEGLHFIGKYQLLFHTRFDLSVTDLL